VARIARSFTSLPLSFALIVMTRSRCFEAARRLAAREIALIQSFGGSDRQTFGSFVILGSDGGLNESDRSGDSRHSSPVFGRGPAIRMQALWRRGRVFMPGLHARSNSCPKTDPPTTPLLAWQSRDPYSPSTGNSAKEGEFLKLAPLWEVGYLPGAARDWEARRNREVFLDQSVRWRVEG
jgi:hypothetical protein